MTSSCPKRRRAKRTPSSILVRTFCLRRCAAISATSPNQDGVEGTDSAEVWMITDPSAILVICTSLRESVLFFLLKEAHFMLARYFLAARCAIRGQRESAKIQNSRMRQFNQTIRNARSNAKGPHSVEGLLS